MAKLSRRASLISSCCCEGNAHLAPQLDGCQEHTESVDRPPSPANRGRGPCRPGDRGSARRRLRPEEEAPHARRLL